MRIVLVGRPEDRARLRRALADTPIEVVHETATLAAARADHADVDGFLIARGAAEEAADQNDEVAAESLTPRELDVLHLLAEGLPNKAIARRLGISDQTVKFHVAAVCGKLGAANRTDAVRLAFQRGLLTV